MMCTRIKCTKKKMSRQLCHNRAFSKIIETLQGETLALLSSSVRLILRLTEPTSSPSVAVKVLSLYPLSKLFNIKAYKNKIRKIYWKYSNAICGDDILCGGNIFCVDSVCNDADDAKNQNSVLRTNEFAVQEYNRFLLFLYRGAAPDKGL